VAAAAVVIVLAGGLGAVRLGVVRAPALASVVGGPSHREPSPTATRPAPLPIYLVAQQAGRWALVREYTTTTLADPEDRLNGALRLAVAGTGADPDLTSAWSVEHLTGDVRAEIGSDGGVTVRLSGVLISTGSGSATAAAPRPDLARIAVQQLVWTATATVGRDVPVRIEGPDAASELFGSVPLGAVFRRATGADDPRAPAWIKSLTDGASLRQGTAEIFGDAQTTSTGMITWTLSQPDGRVVARGQEGLTDGHGQRSPVGARGDFRIRLVLPAPGRYVLSVTQSWPAPDDPTATWTDTKNLLVA
jgi:hypothetical protein